MAPARFCTRPPASHLVTPCLLAAAAVFSLLLACGFLLGPYSSQQHPQAAAAEVHGLASHADAAQPDMAWEKEQSLRVVSHTTRALRLRSRIGPERPKESRNSMAMARSSSCLLNASICEDTASGTTCCVDSCVDTCSDRTNCGRCGTMCLLLQSCCQGRCTDLNLDPQNCGQCGRACPSEICQFGICGYY